MPIFRTVSQPMPQQIAFNQVVTPLSGNIRALLHSFCAEPPATNVGSNSNFPFRHDRLGLKA
jgi:hypothetical protein